MTLEGIKMNNSSILAISPLDGRYCDKLSNIRTTLSEFGLMKFRVIIEVKWLQKLSQIKNLPEVPAFSESANKLLVDIINNFSEKDANRIKEIESTINHDVKAVEYFIKEKISENAELNSISEFIHFGLTSEDINNLAYALMLKTSKNEFIVPLIKELSGQLKNLAIENSELAMLSRTHGQPATPTTLGKEIANFAARINKQLQQLENTDILGKLNGATGNYNALATSCPETDWLKESEEFVKSLDLNWNKYTTQIEPHDYIAELFSSIIRINNILIDFNRDMWSYISLNYFNQKNLANEVGSSTMPHKINPIDFENSEGNLGISNALLEHMANKLPQSRFQRDLTDSTVLRNMGVAIAHSLISYKATAKGLSKLAVNHEVITIDLQNHYEVLAEAVQTVMRRYGIEKPYEKLKNFTRGKQMTKTMLADFIAELQLPADIKNNLLEMTPETYIGYAAKLAKEV